MPQVQFVEPGYQAGTHLSRALGEAGQSALEGFKQRQAQQKENLAIQQLSQGNLSPLQTANLVSQLPPEKQQAYQAYLKESARSANTQQVLSQLFGPVGSPLGSQASMTQPMGQQMMAQPNQMQAQEGIDLQNPASWPEDVLVKASGLARSGGELGVIGNVAQAELSRRQEGRKEEAESYKSSAKYREKLLTDYKGYKSTLNRLDKLEELNKQGKLITPLLAKTLDTFGVPIGALNNPDSEEFQKLSQDLLSGITKTFGNRINVVEVENFLKTIPQLTNSKEGRERIIKNMKLLQRPAELEYEAYRDIRKKGGKLPLDLQEQVFETLEPKLDKLAEEFKSDPATKSKASEMVVIIDPSGIRRSIPKSQLDQALQAGGKLP
jgi:murein DD-endopeptidase MepM/ murein hydrolase activator NlpD